MDANGEREPAPPTADAFTVLTITPVTSAEPLVEFVSSAEVSVAFDAADTASVELWQRFQAAGSPSWTSWELVDSIEASPFEVTLSDGDGAYEFYTVGVSESGVREEAPPTADASTVLDTTAPESELDALPFTVSGASIAIAYSASDDGSGVTDLEVWWRYRSDELSAWTTWTLGPTGSESPVSFDADAGLGFYEFYSIAVDATGHREQAPGVADTHTRLILAYTERVSVGASEANSYSYDAAVSSNGRLVFFASDANLVPGDTNESSDIFVRDRDDGTLARISLGPQGSQSNGGSYAPVVSADGRFVAFISDATDLVPADTNETSDVFVHDRQTGTTTRVSVSSSGAEANESSYDAAVSADGRYVAFLSYADNLVAGDTNEADDIFIHDLQTGATTRVSVASSGAETSGGSYGPSINADGRYVVFGSYADDLVSGDTNEADDIFIHDRQTGATTRVSVSGAGGQANSYSYEPLISGDGRYVVYASDATNLVAGDVNAETDIYVHDRQTGEVTLASRASDGAQANSYSYDAAMSPDGRYVAFVSYATNLAAGDLNESSDVFVHDRQTGLTTRMSVAHNGTEGNSGSYGPKLVADGSEVIFVSDATNLVEGDLNESSDIFVRGEEPP